MNNEVNLDMNDKKKEEDQWIKCISNYGNIKDIYSLHHKDFQRKNEKEHEVAE